MAFQHLPETVTARLRDWRPSADGAVPLRAAYCNALNAAVARNCVKILAPQNASGADELRQSLPALWATGWTTPAVAYANYRGLSQAADPIAQARQTVEELRQIAAAQPPLLVISPADPEPAWVRYALRIFERDQRNEGRGVQLRPIVPSDRLRSEAKEALALLQVVWPEMYATTAVFTREIRWFTSNVTAAGSASLTQGYGAVFVDDSGGTVRLLEHFVHEATHLEFTARMSLDKYLRNGKDGATSPFCSKPRPLTRVLHATAVAARLIEVLDRLDHVGVGDKDRIVKDRNRFAQDLDFGLASLSSHAMWTPLGEELFTSMQPTVLA